jgi:division protein CdvB (Snf7/Vps24/ESCRT-III family)
MTTDERLDRIEHITAGIDEERRKDRDEYKSLWRDTQRQLNELGARVVQMSEENQIAHAQFREADKRLEAHIAQLAEEGKATDKRIAEMVSGIGELIRRLPLPK